MNQLTDFEAHRRDELFEPSGRHVRREPPKPFLGLEPKNERTDCCDGYGMEDPDTECTVCHRCDYCGNVQAAPLDGRDEDGDPVHEACSPGGVFRVAVEAYWTARKAAAAMVGSAL